jgi:hypothetical protein
MILIPSTPSVPSISTVPSISFGLMKQILNFKEEISTKTAETS